MLDGWEFSVQWPNLFTQLPGPQRDQSDQWRMEQGLSNKVTTLMERNGWTEEESFDYLQRLQEQDDRLASLGIDPAPQAAGGNPFGDQQAASQRPDERRRPAAHDARSAAHAASGSADAVSVTLHLGDCRDLLATLDAGSIDAIVSDPPYGIAYHKGESGGGVGGRKRIPGIRRENRTIAGDAEPFDPSPFLDFPCVLFGANHFAARLPSGGSWLCWDKSVGLGPADSFADAEFAWCSVAGVKRNVFRYLWKGICRAGEKGESNRHHPTQKPLSLMAWCLDKLKLEPGMTIFDPFMGSGTTGVACVKAGVNFIGCEIDPTYFRIAERRIAEAATPLFHDSRSTVMRSLSFLVVTLFMATPAQAQFFRGGSACFNGQCGVPASFGFSSSFSAQHAG